jgi:hypothetical protein
MKAAAGAAGRRENMKARISLVFGLLTMCVFLSTGGSPAWAVTSTATLNGAYACAGTGVTTPAFIAFSVSGILDVSDGSVVVSPAGSLWTWDVAGFNLIDIAVSNGTYSATPDGQANLSLAFIPPAPPIPGLPIPLEFDNNVVMSNIDSGGTAHTFVMTFQAPPTFIDLVAVTVCQAESQAVGNPLP